MAIHSLCNLNFEKRHYHEKRYEKKTKEDLPARKPTRSNFWRLKLAPNEKIILGDHQVYSQVVCKNCGPGLISITKFQSSPERGEMVELPCGQLKIFWVHDNLQVEGDPIHPAVVDMQFISIVK